LSGQLGSGIRLTRYRNHWYATWRENGQTIRRSLRSQDRHEAERALDDYKRALGRPSDHVGSIYQAYLADKPTERARWAWKRLERHFSALRPDQIDRAASRRYVTARRKDGVSDGTIWTEMTMLRAALRWQDRNTPAVVELPSKPPPADKYLTRAEYDRLLSLADTPHIRLFIILALSTAGRMTAILELTWDRIDFERELIRLGDGTKRRKGRATVPMTPRAKEALLAAFEARTCNHVIEYGGESVKKVRKALGRVTEKAGVPWCTPHTFRHSAAVWLAESGAAMPEIAAILGHSDSRITEAIYAKFSPTFLRKAISALA
jgi:integrase